MNNDREDFIYKLALGVLINFNLVILALISLDIKLDILKLTYILIISLSFILLFRLVTKKAIIMGILIVVISSTIVYLHHFYQQFLSKIIATINDFIFWSIRYIYGMTFLYKEYTYVFIGVITIILGAIIYFSVFKISKTYPLIVCGTILFMYRWFLYEDKAFDYYIFYIMIVLQLYTYRVYIERKKSWMNSNKSLKGNISKRWIIVSNIIVIAIVLIGVFLPKNFRPITWRWLDDKVQDTFPQLAEWRNMKKASVGYGNELKFDLSQTQYQDNYKRLGGPVKQDKILLMEITSEEPVYLRGQVKDFYTGSYWKSTDDKYYQQLTSTNINLKESKSTEGEIIYQSIKHINISTSTIFSSYIPIRVGYDSNWFYCTDEFELISGELLLKGDGYKVYSVKKYVDNDLIHNTEYRYREEHKKYLQLPKTLPDRVINLAKNITWDKKSDYDKINAIINYLKSSYKYSLEPEETPHNRDFVDYFLFDIKEGYCTYYASALTVMTRCIGIPSRYVEGFKMPDRKSNGVYYVYSNNAHAWTEVFIEGYGWMTFEPTPGYGNILYAEKEDKKEPKDYNNTVNNKKGLDYYSHELTKLEKLENGVVFRENVNLQIKSKYENIDKYAIIVLVFAILIILIRIITSIIKIKRLNFENNEDKEKAVLNYYIWIMNLLQELNKGRLIHETTIEYSKRINTEKESSIDKEGLNEITLIFNKVMYGNEKITDKELEIVKNYFIKCERLVFNRIGFFRYMYSKYITMKFYTLKKKGDVVGLQGNCN